MREPEVWPLERLLAEDLGPAVGLGDAERPGSNCGAVASAPRPARGASTATRTLIVIGGGADRCREGFRAGPAGSALVAIPSIWGSGAEASPVAITQDGARKMIRCGAQYLPDFRVRWPELAESRPRD